MFISIVTCYHRIHYTGMYFWHDCIKVNIGLSLIQDYYAKFRVRTHFSSQQSCRKQKSLGIIIWGIVMVSWCQWPKLAIKVELRFGGFRLWFGLKKSQSVGRRSSYLETGSRRGLTAVLRQEQWLPYYCIPYSLQLDHVLINAAKTPLSALQWRPFFISRMFFFCGDQGRSNEQLFWFLSPYYLTPYLNELILADALPVSVLEIL